MRTGNTVVVGIAFLLALQATQARGDVGVPGFRDQMDRLRFDNLADYPDYTVHLQCQRGNGSPAVAPVRSIEVYSGEPVEPPGTGRRVKGLVLVAVPRTTPRPKDADTVWPTKDTPGAVRSESLASPEDYVFYLNPNRSVHPYRVELRDGILLVTPLAEERGIWVGSVCVPSWPVGVVLSVSLAWAGIWFVRRRRAARARRNRPQFLSE